MFGIGSCKLIWFSIVCGALSAVAWLASALITPAVVIPTYNGPTKKVEMKLKHGALCNAAGAFLAALSIGAQAYVLYRGL